MPQLSWDLHLHPAPSAAPRWGDGLRVWEAAREAGVQGFVWKSHEEHTAERSAALPDGPPDAIGSASLNAFANPESVMGAVAQGARWIWGPSRDAAGRLAWDLSLPAWWPELRAELVRLQKPLVLATSHLGVEGRLELATTAAEMGAYCSVTHSLYLSDQDARVLAGLSCAFELDLYTAAHPIADRPPADLLARATSLRETGSLVYFTSDAGQAHVGNPFEFSRQMLDTLASRGNPGLIAELAGTNPATVVGRVWP